MTRPVTRRATNAGSLLAWGQSVREMNTLFGSRALTRLTHADRNAPHLPGTRDFSFSGLKTSVLRHVMRRREALSVESDAPLPAGGFRQRDA